MVVVATVVACARAPEPDAYGNFEAEEVVVSSELTGQVEEFTATEGQRLERGTIAAVVDTAMLALEREQASAQAAASSARTAEVAGQIGVLEAQLAVARRAYQRTERLYEQEAATAPQLDQAEREYRTLVAQLGTARAQQRTVGQDVEAAEARAAQIGERIERSRVANPRTGIVLAVYAREGEVVQAGQPLYRIANLDTLTLRAYISGDQLGSVRLGQRVEVNVDGPEGSRGLPGVVEWVASSAEFTPTPIQTREERVDLVYAVQIRVPNPEGLLKIGMPADVSFGADELAESQSP